jgi:drug/metabolite transporter (DMT)-like permease
MWILLSLLSGLSDATRDAISKRGSGTIPHVMISWSYSLFALPFFLPVLLLSAPSELPLEFWLLAIGIGAAHVLGSLGVVYSLSRSELSLCVPMTAFSPVFLLVIGPMMNGHAPSSHAIFGTVLVTAGCYLLNISDIRRGLLAPVVSLAREPGVRMMLLLSVFWSFSAAIDLNAVRKFGLPFWAASELFAIAILFVPVVIYKKGLKGMTPMGWRTLPLIGMANACSFGPYLLALSSTHALYVICLKRSNIFFSLLVGRIACAVGSSALLSCSQGLLSSPCGDKPCSMLEVSAPMAKTEQPLKGFKQSLPTKVCPVCKLPFSWRKKWRRTWEQVIYCSERCRRTGRGA